MPKIVRKNKDALSKEDVTDILNACSDIRLKTYVMFLAAGGFRVVEVLSIRVKDLELESKPAYVFVRGEYTKTRADRIVFFTDEVGLWCWEFGLLFVTVFTQEINPSVGLIGSIILFHSAVEVKADAAYGAPTLLKVQMAVY